MKRCWSKAGVNALLAFKCCIENSRDVILSIGGFVAPGVGLACHAIAGRRSEKRWTNQRNLAKRTQAGSKKVKNYNKVERNVSDPHPSCCQTLSLFCFTKKAGPDEACLLQDCMDRA